MLEATFVSKKELEEPDLVVLDQLDLRRPKNRLRQYAQFRSYRPGLSSLCGTKHVEQIAAPVDQIEIGGFWP
jgi:hypothetical protein